MSARGSQAPRWGESCACSRHGGLWAPSASPVPAPCRGQRGAEADKLQTKILKIILTMKQKFLLFFSFKKKTPCAFKSAGGRAVADLQVSNCTPSPTSQVGEGPGHATGDGCAWGLFTPRSPAIPRMVRIFFFLNRRDASLPPGAPAVPPPLRGGGGSGNSSVFFLTRQFYINTITHPTLMLTHQILLTFNENS